MLRRLPDDVFLLNQWAILASGLRIRAGPRSKSGRHRGVPAEDPHQADQVVAGPVAADIGLGRAETAAENQMAIEARVADLDLGRQRALARASEFPALAAVVDHQSATVESSPSDARPSGAARGPRRRPVRLRSVRQSGESTSVMVAAPPVPDDASDEDRTDISSSTIEMPASRWPGPPARSSTG